MRAQLPKCKIYYSATISLDIQIGKYIKSTELKNPEIHTHTHTHTHIYGSDGKESACNVRNQGSFPGLGRPPGVGHDNPLQDSCLKNPTDRGPWWATVHGVANSWIQLSD